MLETIVVKLWKLDGEKHMIRATLLSFIDDFYLTKGESVQPIHSHHSALTMLLNEFRKMNHFRLCFRIIFNLSRSRILQASISNNIWPHTKIVDPLTKAPMLSEYWDGGSTHLHCFLWSVYIINGEGKLGISRYVLEVNW